MPASPAKGVIDAWFALPLELELKDLQGTPYCGGTADIQQIFDPIQRDIIYKAAELAGMP